MNRKARAGRNPQPGDAIKIKASKSGRFNPSPKLKEGLQEGVQTKIAEEERQVTHQVVFPSRLILLYDEGGWFAL